MDKDFYINIGYGVAWFAKIIFIPIGVAVTARIIAEIILTPHPRRQRKKRFNKNRLK